MWSYHALSRLGYSEQYEKNFERIFGKKTKKQRIIAFIKKLFKK
jgi:hypothetical protein